MRKTGILTLIALATAVLAQQRGNFTYERLAERHDADGDGVVSKEEFRGNPNQFERIDRNQDGKVTKAEFDEMLRAWKNQRSNQAGNRFEQQGLKPGEKVPDLTVYDLEGNKVRLSSLWKDKPALLVTASATCPISVRTCPALKELASANANYVNVAVLYIKEAHPSAGPASDARALGREAHPRPASLEERLKLANLFNEEVKHGTRILVDGIDNEAAAALGAGPNIGLYVADDGTIIRKQGWFEPRAMTLAIVEFDGVLPVANTPEPPKRTYRQRRIPDNVVVHRDLEYAVEDSQSLKLDLYLPKKTGTKPPLLVWIHGGGWKNGDKSNVNGAILRLSSEGYAVASINYRLKDLSIHPKNIHDCKGAVRWLRAHADTFGFDPERVAVGGGSAGGHLSLLLALSHGFQELEGTVGGNLDRSSAVKAIIDFYGPSDFMAFAKSSERFNRAHDYQLEQLKHASPATYLSTNAPPVLIFHGDQDTTVPVEQSKLLYERYKELGLEAELHILKGAGHGGMVFSDDERYALIKDFLSRHL